MIRKATNADIEAIIHLGEKCHAKSFMRQYPIHRQYVELTLYTAIQKGAIFVDADDERIHGFIISGITVAWWNPDIKIGTDMMFYSTRAGKGIKLLGRMIEWCAEKNVQYIMCAVECNKSVDDVEKMYLEAGFHREGSFFVLPSLEYDKCLESVA